MHERGYRLGNCASHVPLSLFENIIRLSLSVFFCQPFDSIAIATAMRTRWNIANIKHSFVVVFSIAFSCLLSNIPLRLSDSILLRLRENSNSSSTPTKNLFYICTNLSKRSRSEINPFLFPFWSWVFSWLVTKPLYVDRAPFSTEEPARRLLKLESLSSRRFWFTDGYRK